MKFILGRERWRLYPASLHMGMGKPLASALDRMRSYDFAKEFADRAARLLEKSDSYWVRRVTDKHGKWFLVKVTSFMLYDFVTRSFESLRPMIEPFPKDFLRGFFTAEGNPSVSIEHPLHGPYLNVGLSVSNSDSNLLEFTRKLLLMLGYHPGMIRVNIAEGEWTNLSVARSTGMLMNLSRLEESRRFAQDIGFSDSEKQSKLLEAIGLIDVHGRRDAAIIWTEDYEKVGKKWSRKKKPLTSSG